MKKNFAALVLAGGMTQASAWEFDMAEVTCSDLENAEQAAMMMFWLDGYISAEEEDTTVSSDWIEELGNYLKEGCTEGNYKVLEIIRAKYLDQ